MKPFFYAMNAGEFKAVTSTITLAEVLVHPFRHSQPVLAARYRQILLQARNLTAIPVTASIAHKAAELRAQYGFRTPDAIQVATAIHRKAGAFLTNDKRISLGGDLRVLTLADFRGSVT